MILRSWRPPPKVRGRPLPWAHAKRARVPPPPAAAGGGGWAAHVPVLALCPSNAAWRATACHESSCDPAAVSFYTCGDMMRLARRHCPRTARRPQRRCQARRGWVPLPRSFTLARHYLIATARASLEPRAVHPQYLYPLTYLPFLRQVTRTLGVYPQERGHPARAPRTHARGARRYFSLLVKGRGPCPARPAPFCRKAATVATSTTRAPGLCPRAPGPHGAPLAARPRCCPGALSSPHCARCPACDTSDAPSLPPPALCHLPPAPPCTHAA